jgi:predicted SAM-dependent methyltransferase
VLFRVHAVRLLPHWFGRPIRDLRQARLLRRQIESNDRIRLALGSSSHCTDGWIAAGCDQFDLVDPASWSWYFQKSSVDAILAENVWEHLSRIEGKTAARNCFQFLRPGGYLRVAVPDEFHPSQQYQNQLRNDGELGTTSSCVLYNHHSFAEVFVSLGFQVRLIEFFDQAGAFHSNQWDVSKGLVQRTLLFDERNITQPFAYTSLVLDAFKPDSQAMGLVPESCHASELEFPGGGKVAVAEDKQHGKQKDSHRDAA